jgi:trk system potassium uptake protein TrkA
VRVIVVGAGEVGSNIAASLAEEHDVVVIDRDVDRVESLQYELDVLAIEGDGTDLSTLEEAGVAESDLLVASTDNDEANIVVCASAETIADPFSIARVKNANLLDTWERTPQAFGVDFMVSSDLLTAQAIVRVIGLPDARDVDTFAGGAVQMAEFEVPKGSPVANQTVAQADRYDALTFAAILRNGAVVVARGSTEIRADDRLVVIGTPEAVRSFAGTIGTETPGSEKDIVIVGGSAIGYHTAHSLETRGFHPRLIERDPERARRLAERLPETTVMEHDATDQAFLEREHVGEADLVVAALDNDEKNLLVSLLAKRAGADRTVAVVEAGAYADLFETVGVDIAVNPRRLTAEEITRFTRENRMENVALIESDLAEVLEVQIDADSVLANRPLSESAADLPNGVVVGAVTRDGRYVRPRGDTVIEVGDHAVVFVETSELAAVTDEL